MCRLGNSPIRKRPSDEMSGRSLHLQELASFGLILGIETYLLKFRKPLILSSQKSNLRARDNVFELRCEALGHALKLTSFDV
jgi:hypothetical protein